MPIERDAKIAPTAHYTAYVWHHLGLPYAELFATREGRAMFWAFRAAGEWIAATSKSLPSMAQYLGMRHRLIDRRLVELAPELVVELGAGLSRRGVTWALDHDVDYWEVDLPHMVRRKRALLIERAPALLERASRRLRWASMDVLGGGFVEWLEHQVRGRRVAVVAEGLLSYFPIDERRVLFGAIRGALATAAHGVVLCDVRDRAAGARLRAGEQILRAGIRLVTRGRGVAKDFDSPDAARAFFLEAGFSSAEPMSLGGVPDLAHLPFPARVWELSLGGEAHRVENTGL
jgi:O-methyltransferase involved in polyketide biosynthesis